MNLEKVKDISKGILFYIFAMISLVILFKVFAFYIPFLVAFIIAEILEPLIKFTKNKTNLSRKTSSIIVLVLFFVLCITILSVGIVFLVSETTNVLSKLNRLY